MYLFNLMKEIVVSRPLHCPNSCYVYTINYFTENKNKK